LSCGATSGSRWLHEIKLEIEGLTGAGYGEKSQERLAHRNGYRDRIWETRAGSVDGATFRVD
jgi:transposase-like protein